MKSFTRMRWLSVVLLVTVTVWSVPAAARFISVDPQAARYPHVTPYAYALNNPVTNTDPDGQAAETVVDVVSVGIGAYELYENPSWGNAGWLALDVVCAVVPFVPAAGAARHAGKVDNFLRGADDAIDAGKRSGNVPNPHGRLGGKAHREGVEKAKHRAREEYSGQDVSIKGEGKINTPGGEKSTRYGDVVVYKNKEPVKAYQVGDVNKDGVTPVARERKAMKDIKKQGVKAEYIKKKE